MCYVYVLGKTIFQMLIFVASHSESYFMKEKEGRKEGNGLFNGKWFI